MAENTALAEEQTEASPAIPARFSSLRAYAQTFAATAAIRCLGIVSGVLAARLLGPVGRGELAVVIFLPLVLAPLGELELPRSLAYEVSRMQEVPAALLATSVWLAFILGSVQALILVAALPFYLPVDKLHLLVACRWFAFYLPLAYVTSTLLGSDQGRGRFGRFSVLLSLPGLIYVVAILAAWFSGRISPQIFAAGILAGAVVAFVVRLKVDWHAIAHTLPKWQTAVQLLRRGMSFYFPAVASLALSRADMFILVRLMPNDAIGLYAVAQAIALGQIGTVTPFIQVGFSAVAGEIDEQQALKTMARHFRLAQFAVLGVGLSAVALTPWLIRLMFGARYVGAVTTSYLLIISAVFWGLDQVLEQGLRAAGHPYAGLVSNSLGMFVLAAFGITGCIHHGIVGLASATVAAQFVNLSILIGFAVLRLRMPLGSFWALHADSIRELDQMSNRLRSRISARRLADTR